MPFHYDNKLALKAYYGDHDHEVDRLYLGSNLFFQRPNNPIINTFEISPESIDYSSLPRTDNLTIRFTVTNSTHNALSIRDGSGSRNIPLTTPTSAFVAMPTVDSGIFLTATNIEGSTTIRRSFTVYRAVDVSIRAVGSILQQVSGANIIAQQHITFSAVGNPYPTLSITNSRLNVDQDARRGRFNLIISRTLVPGAHAQSITYVLTGSNGRTTDSDSLTIRWPAGVGG